MVGLTYVLAGLVGLMAVRALWDTAYLLGRRDERRALARWDSWENYN
jgi:hypothetical protein